MLLWISLMRARFTLEDFQTPFFTILQRAKRESRQERLMCNNTVYCRFWRVKWYVDGGRETAKSVLVDSEPSDRTALSSAQRLYSRSIVIERRCRLRSRISVNA